ncbi:class I SAM-dependent methyltransferase [Candidatus Dojkabacteria bacterium]|uniref:Class I SAM-dependent methyltransferase n=1 Tax=Candidatus Dojkabacteria bacterium TaxID=2099670 RepID=A0A955KV68_9BACT|nr:class I SAM-dependent methyltransferase [Candidatus Dojkabacteria bacterium]MCB9790735.1 class I SAM-dependent methyltransferase [Candidatus Nomurabacteria bacterium]
MQKALLISSMLLAILFFAGVIVTYLANMILAPSIMTPRKIVPEILKSMNLKKGVKLIDLGSGDGRIIIGAVKLYNAKVVGYEISPILAMLSRLLKITKTGLKGSYEIKSDSIFRADLKGIDIVYCHLNEKAMKPLVKKLKQELQDNAKVFTFHYQFPEIKESAKHLLSNGDLVYEYSAKALQK